MPRITRRLDRRRLNVAAHNAVRRAAARVGLHVTRADFNSPIVDARTMDPAVWDRPAPLHGLELDLDAQLAMIDERLAPYIAEFDAKPGVPDPTGFDLANPWYGPMDAPILYAMLRAAPPGRVLELGSGFSSLVIARALQANGGDSRHEIVDPFASDVLAGIRDRVDVRRESAATVDPSLFDALNPGDVLFVDTSHVVRPAGEVVRIVLEVLPTLAPGVLVHFHDIYLPFVYPRVFYDLFNVHWQEQYLLQAFLSYNAGFRLLCANHALWRLRRDRSFELFAGLHPGREPSGFWFERVG